LQKALESEVAARIRTKNIGCFVVMCECDGAHSLELKCEEAICRYLQKREFFVSVCVCVCVSYVTMNIIFRT